MWILGLWMSLFSDQTVVMKAVCVNTLRKKSFNYFMFSSYSQIVNFSCPLQMRLIFTIQEQAWTLCRGLTVFKYFRDILVKTPHASVKKEENSCCFCKAYVEYVSILERRKVEIRQEKNHVVDCLFHFSNATLISYSPLFRNRNWYWSYCNSMFPVMQHYPGISNLLERQYHLRIHCSISNCLTLI